MCIRDRQETQDELEKQLQENSAEQQALSEELAQWHRQYAVSYTHLADLPFKRSRTPVAIYGFLHVKQPCLLVPYF